MTLKKSHILVYFFYGSLRRLGLEYVDLYLIHFPVRLRQGVKGINYNNGDILPFDMKGTWEDMEKCVNLGLTKSIGLSNFGIKRISEILQYATIPPALVTVFFFLLFLNISLTI